MVSLLNGIAMLGAIGNYRCPLRSMPMLRATQSVMADAASSSAMDDAEDSLLSLLRSSSSQRGAALSTEAKSDVFRLAEQLEELHADDFDTNDSPLLPGRWRVLFQGKPGTDVSAFSLESWQKYLAGDGPSPIQNLVSGSSSVSRLYQVVEFGEDGASGRVNNVVDLSPRAVIAIEAVLEGRPKPCRLAFRFTGGRILLRALWGGALSLPYPVPFELLGDNARGWLQTCYISPRLRLSRGNKGSLFVLVPEPEPDDPELELLLAPAAPPPASPSPQELRKNPVVVCPAQLGTERDYADLTDALRERGHPVVVAPLRFTDWLRLIPAALSAEYWRGELSPEVALPFYYEALDAAIERAQSEFGGRPVHLVGHSIGGWIARAYLGQLSDQRRGAIDSLTTLGTPHAPPPEGPFRTLDQTRGLLTYVEDRFPGAFHESIRYQTVGSRAVRGKASSITELDGLLASASYLPLCGDAFVEGDGITPLQCAHLEGAEQREVEAFHIAFVPGIGARLLGTRWYGSKEVVEEWAAFLS
jgi:hypothetical protein